MFSKRRVDKLLDRFHPRLKRVPFTIDGIPAQEEVNLTVDIWSALTARERETIITNTSNVVAQEEQISLDELPDQTPYAMRLTHRFLQMQSRKS